MLPTFDKQQVIAINPSAFAIAICQLDEAIREAVTATELRSVILDQAATIGRLEERIAALEATK